MLNAKHLCKLTVVVGPPTIIKAGRCMKNHEYFGYERSLNGLFNLLYGYHYNRGRIRPFKVVLGSSDWYWHAD